MRSRVPIVITISIILLAVISYNLYNRSTPTTAISTIDKIQPQAETVKNSTYISSNMNVSVGKNGVEYTINQLTQAILENNLELVERIIENKDVDINVKDSEGKYPIENILVMNNCDMAKILLGAGADPYLTTSDGTTVFDKVMAGNSTYLKSIFSEYKK